MEIPFWLRVSKVILVTFAFKIVSASETNLVDVSTLYFFDDDVFW